MDASELVDLLKAQGDAISGLKQELTGLREYQRDLSSSFTQHGVKQALTLSFI
jgi:hypothetical protein